MISQHDWALLRPVHVIPRCHWTSNRPFTQCFIKCLLRRLPQLITKKAKPGVGELWPAERTGGRSRLQWELAGQAHWQCSQTAGGSSRGSAVWPVLLGSKNSLPTPRCVSIPKQSIKQTNKWWNTVPFKAWMEKTLTSLLTAKRNLR